MKQTLFEGYGIEIFKNEGKYFIRHEVGEIAPRLEDLEVTQAEAERAQKSWPDCYQVILAYQLRADEAAQKGVP